MDIEEDRREGIVVFRCRGRWQLRQEEILNRVHDLLVQGERRYIFNVSETPGADWLAGEFLAIANECRESDARLRIVVNEDWSSFLKMAKLDEFLPTSGTEDEAVVELGP